MSRAMHQRIDFVEPLAVFGLIMGYIWEWRYRHPGFWWLILAGIIISHLFRRENGAKLGFSRRNLRESVQEFAPLVAFLALAMVAAGILFRTTRPIQPGDAFLAWAGYVPWGT